MGCFSALLGMTNRGLFLRSGRDGNYLLSGSGWQPLVEVLILSDIEPNGAKTGSIILKSCRNILS